LKKSFALWPFLWHLSDDQKYYCDVNLPPAAKKKELKKFVIVYFFDVVSVKEPKKIWKKCPKMLFVKGSFFV